MGGWSSAISDIVEPALVCDLACVRPPRRQVPYRRLNRQGLCSTDLTLHLTVNTPQVLVDKVLLAFWLLEWVPLEHLLEFASSLRSTPLQILSQVWEDLLRVIPVLR